MIKNITKSTFKKFDKKKIYYSANSYDLSCSNNLRHPVIKTFTTLVTKILTLRKGKYTVGGGFDYQTHLAPRIKKD
jgi:hypothetical protein